MNIKQIVDKIIRESDVQSSDYSLTARIEDVNFEYLYRVEKTVQIGSDSPAAAADEDFSEEFAVVDGSNAFDRTIVDVPIFRVDFKPTGGSRFERVRKDPKRMINGWCWGDTRFFTTEKQVFVEEGYAGTLRVTYARGQVVPFTLDDYNETPDADIPSPDFLPEVFHPLLWLKPAMMQAGYYKKDRYPVLKAEFERLEALFDNHYGRDAVPDSQFVTDESDGCFRGSNNR